MDDKKKVNESGLESVSGGAVQAATGLARDELVRDLSMMARACLNAKLEKSDYFRKADQMHPHYNHMFGQIPDDEFEVCKEEGWEKALEYGRIHGLIS